MWSPLKQMHIRLTDSQYEALERVSKRSGIGLAELVRRSIDLYLETTNEPVEVDIRDRYSDD